MAKQCWSLLFIAALFASSYGAESEAGTPGIPSSLEPRIRADFHAGNDGSAAYVHENLKASENPEELQDIVAMLQQLSSKKLRMLRDLLDSDLLDSDGLNSASSQSEIALRGEKRTTGRKLQGYGTYSNFIKEGVRARNAGNRDLSDQHFSAAAQHALLKFHQKANNRKKHRRKMPDGSKQITNKGKYDHAGMKRGLWASRAASASNKMRSPPDLGARIDRHAQNYNDIYYQLYGYGPMG
mmetsp:Transcript_25382/g.41773  ORF Transcript_25382/g.41773 Transcript_25382/m.41773 type:complete len:240 (+) Transcript_25382:184-903(+)|eukprot:CAMPEP_0184656352 /NCGR_PEP_ID=MMETSP0308-20130426/16414_1 /TAXON_ID=38269 /ORGANISM="Gloeochaete witrockiana, Strain SAG 46.84" /LENGTH=239 /DNA_ID=CAMNT_0027093431 /DNA_START=103 /DNA_END=822 /DNA_ORIENTATION=-